MNAPSVAATSMAEQMADYIAKHAKQPGVVQIGVAQSDAEARRLGFPDLDAAVARVNAVKAKLEALGVTVHLVPRGSTPESQAAMLAHGVS